LDIKMELKNKKLRVGFQDLIIKVESPSFTKDNLTDCYGQYIQRENAIQINEGLEPHDLLNTVIHEVFHACTYVSGLTQKDNPLSDDDKEETVVNNLANTFHVVLRDNPWLIKFIQEAITKPKTKEK
tara:strand:- start:1802 stop:2182 length:381 start_codon:yes stop_codon:yes gene_type:complete